MAAATKQLDRLQAVFKGTEVKQRAGRGSTKLTYIPIDATINRVNEVLGPNWGVVPPTHTDLQPPTEPGGNWFAKSEVFITATIDGAEKSLYGIGASVGKDPDDAGKTALAEGIKKAFHQAGVGLYLWDPEARAAAEASMAVGTAAGRKKAIKALAAERLGIDNPTMEQVAAVFEVEDANDLKSDAKISEILTAEGLM